MHIQSLRHNYIWPNIQPLIMYNILFLDHILSSTMPSSNHRASSTRPSRSFQNNTRIQPVRSASVSYRQFTIVITNNPELLRHTRAYQPQVSESKT